MKLSLLSSKSNGHVSTGWPFSEPCRVPTERSTGSRRGGLSSCGVQTYWLWRMGFVLPWHVNLPGPGGQCPLHPQADSYPRTAWEVPPPFFSSSLHCYTSTSPHSFTPNPAAWPCSSFSTSLVLLYLWVFVHTAPSASNDLPLVY